MVPIRATYRLQFRNGVGFRQARELVNYLDGLGVSHLYASPIFRARAGSTHGYDVVDPGMFDPALGTRQDFEELVAALRARGMGLVLDIVPNHMAVGPENFRWEDVLRLGPESAYANWFDVGWRSPHTDAGARVLLPILGDYLTRILERDEIRLSVEGGELRVRYYEHTLPLHPRSIPQILEFDMPALVRNRSDGELFVARLQGISAALSRSGGRHKKPAAPSSKPELPSAPHEQLRALVLSDEPFRVALEDSARRFGEGTAGRRRLHRLLHGQAYRLAHWRRASREINYRRFFDINDLIGLHMERPAVFDEYHRLIFQLCDADQIDGLRVDHIDGMLDPAAYLQALRTRLNGNRAADGRRPIYIEKILAEHEALPDRWPTEGETGYQFLNRLDAIFIDPRGMREIEQTYELVLGHRSRFQDAAVQSKRQILETDLDAYARQLAQELVRLAEGVGLGPELRGMDSVRTAVVDVIAHLAVYRSYVSEDQPLPDDQHREFLLTALRRAQADAVVPPAIFDFLEQVLLRWPDVAADEPLARRRLRFVQRFQQLSGPAAAKGIEDTAFYRHFPLAARNEVGGEPDLPLDSAVESLHRFFAERARRTPLALNTVSTHDTKRSADVRSRLAVLSEVPQDWHHAVVRWMQWSDEFRAEAAGHRVPEDNARYLCFQTLLGIWPCRTSGGRPLPDERTDLRDRLKAYMLKAAREAKVFTSWVDPNGEYESALSSFVDQLFSPAGQVLIDDLSRFAQRIAPAGVWNALARTLVHLTAPGVPDIYQGDEQWNFTLVDPDNRRAVPFGELQEHLTEVGPRWSDSAAPQDSEAPGESPANHVAKQAFTQRVLSCRRTHAQVFDVGAYYPVEARGSRAEQLFAYLRVAAAGSALVVVPRITLSALPAINTCPVGEDLWSDTRIVLPEEFPGSRWSSILDDNDFDARKGQELGAGYLLHRVPAALLVAPA